MTTADRIRQLGFKRWYERALLESHAYLVLAIFGLILIFAGLEAMAARAGAASSVIGFVAAVMGGFFAGSGIHRYLRLMALATSLSAHATCPRCQRYAAFTLTASGPSNADTDEPPWLKVRCRQCNHEWTLPPQAESMPA